MWLVIGFVEIVTAPNSPKNDLVLPLFGRWIKLLFIQAAPRQQLVMGQSTRAISTTVMRRDIDSAAKFVGAGAATVGCAGSG